MKIFDKSLFSAQVEIKDEIYQSDNYCRCDVIIQTFSQRAPIRMTFILFDLGR